MDDEIATIRYFMDEVLVYGDDIGILVTPDYSDNRQDKVIEYDVIETSEREVNPHLNIQKELEPGESLEEVYFEECERLEEEFSDAELHYVEDSESLAREMP